MAKLIHGRAKWLSDEMYLKILYRGIFGKPLHLQSPRTFNEKLQWLKLHDRNPLYTGMVDKVEAKEIAAGKIGRQHIIPTLGVWDSFDQIDFASLPQQFVLKCSHDSGGLVIVKNKADLDMRSAKKKINRSLRRNYYWQSREWPYKNVKPRILAEAYVGSNGEDLRDYKFFCFNGEPKYLFVASDRNTPGEEVKFDYFDMDFNKLNMKQCAHPNSNYCLQKPASFEEMICLAKILSRGIPQVRIDFYEVNGQVLFGEFTFFHHGGFVPFEPDHIDFEWGQNILLPEINKQ